MLRSLVNCCCYDTSGECKSFDAKSVHHLDEGKKNMFDFHYTDINSRFGGSLGACHPKIYWVLLGGTLFESYP